MSQGHPKRSTLVMGIVNVTPDSFSDGGKFATTEAALARVHQLIADGVDILDIGAESTRPGFTPLSHAEEWSRLEVVLREVRKEVTVPISVDTYHPETAERALQLGVDIINDISACRDPRMVDVMRGSDKQYVYMHNRDHVARDLTIAQIVEETARGVDRLLSGGVRKEQIIVDPGVGFAKNQAQNLACIRHIDLFSELGYPILLGTSRKRVIGNVLDLPVDERLEGSLATVAYGVLHGVDIVRVHDVLETVRLRNMLEAIVGECNG